MNKLNTYKIITKFIIAGIFGIMIIRKLIENYISLEFLMITLYISAFLLFSLLVFSILIYFEKRKIQKRK